MKSPCEDRKRELEEGDTPDVTTSNDFLVEGPRMHSSNSCKRPRHKTPPSPTTPTSAARAVLSLEGSLSEEVLLRCLSFLDVGDLLAISRVSRAWSRLSADSQLWRRLYLSNFASSRPSSKVYSSLKRRTRPWRDLYKISTNWRKGTARPVNLKEKVRESVLRDVIRPIDLNVDEAEDRDERTTRRQLPERLESRNATDTILQFHQKYFFTASRSPVEDGDVPFVEVHRTSLDGEEESVSLGVIISESIRRFWDDRLEAVKLAITELQLDSTSSPDGSLRLAVFYSTGQFSIFHLQLPSSLSLSATKIQQAPFVATELYTSLSLVPCYPGSTTFDPILLSRFHSPLLVTCTESFTVHFYRIEYNAKGDGSIGTLTVEESEPTYTSKESWWPVVLTLEPIQNNFRQEDSDAYGYGNHSDSEADGDQFRVTLAFSTPVFPSNWSVGIQEFTIILASPCFSNITPYHHHPTSRRLRIIQRHAIARPDRYALAPGGRRPTGSLVTSIEHSGKYIVTSRSDNTIEVFEIVSNSSSPTVASTYDARAVSRKPLTILHLRTLFGHTSSVSSVAVEEGRCVSGGVDGKVKVWELESNHADAISITEEEAEDVGKGSDMVGWHRLWEGAAERDRREGRKIKRVWFDEEKIVSIVEESHDHTGVGRATSERVRVLHFG